MRSIKQSRRRVRHLSYKIFMVTTKMRLIWSTFREIYFFFIEEHKKSIIIAIFLGLYLATGIGILNYFNLSDRFYELTTGQTKIDDLIQVGLLSYLKSVGLLLILIFPSFFLFSRFACILVVLFNANIMYVFIAMAPLLS